MGSWNFDPAITGSAYHEALAPITHRLGTGPQTQSGVVSRPSSAAACLRMQENAEPSWSQLADRQSGTLGWRQALTAGLPQAAWDWKLERGLWRSVGAGVAVTHSGEPTPAQREWAAVIHAGRGAALSGDASLVHFGVRRIPITSYDVAVPVERKVQRIDTDELTMNPHRVRHLHRWSAGHPHLPLVHVTAAVLHAAAWAATDELAEERIAMVVQQRKTTARAIHDLLPQMPRLPRRALILEVLEDVRFGAHAKSEIEFLRFCRRNGLPTPDQMQVLVRTTGKRYLDALYRALKLHVEVDGAHHMWVEQWNADAMRSLELVAAMRGTGEVTVRITRSMMRHQEQKTAGLLRALLLP